MLQETNGRLVLCEIFFTSEGGIGAAYVDWKEARRDKDMILKDIAGQIRTLTEFHVQKGGGVKMKKNGRWIERKLKHKKQKFTKITDKEFLKNLKKL